MIDHITKYSPSLVGLMETKVKLQNAVRINSCMPQAWASCNNCQFSNNGRLSVFWNHSIWSCTELAKSSQ